MRAAPAGGAPPLRARRTSHQSFLAVSALPHRRNVENLPKDAACVLLLAEHVATLATD
jgi:hypothetical protein